ncbi:MAG: outer membrane beta-barrel protein [Bacteroidota bacterium]
MKKYFFGKRIYRCIIRKAGIGLLLLFVLFFRNHSHAQGLGDLAGPKFKASLDAAKEKEKGNSSTTKKVNYGFNIGVYFYAEFNRPNKNEVDEFIPAGGPHKENGFMLSGGIQYIKKGSKDKEGDGKTTLSYLELLIHLMYCQEVSNGYVYAGLGPYISYGIGGKFKGPGFSENAFGGDGGYKRFDAGPSLMAGYATTIGLSIDLSYELGLVNKSPDPSDYTSRNRAFSINVGYSLNKLFGKK